MSFKYKDPILPDPAGGIIIKSEDLETKKSCGTMTEVNQRLAARRIKKKRPRSTSTAS